jgi:hypothetical protein
MIFSAPNVEKKVRDFWVFYFILFHFFVHFVAIKGAEETGN